jgi:F420-non-reducing hydrogenase iron-sulfur subunit
MSHAVCPDVIVYVCANCIPEGGRLARQWKQDDARVLVREVPCSGKMDAQYLLHALEGGARGLCVVACPKGECRLAQGNYRAEVRLRTLQRLLGEIGLEAERARLLHNSPDDAPGQLAEIVRQAVRELCALGPSPLAVSHEL